MNISGHCWTVHNKKALIAQGFLHLFGLLRIMIGGSAWEANNSHNKLIL